MRKPMIAGNWKLNKTLIEAKELAASLASGCQDIDDREIVIAPIFTALASIAEVIQNSPVQLSAQNCYPEETGAFTGEVSPLFLKDAGCKFVILGHSERRQILGETDQLINLKMLKALESGLKPIFCIGETLQERENDQMLEILSQQVRGGLANLTTEQMAEVVIAYEPVWAIGTGKTATDEQAQEAHSFIRGMLQGLFNQQTANETRILYGGSVKPGNVDGLMAQDDIDGALVGGASLNAEDFLRIVKFEN
jgi:triosephosphate isomerase (TIM)